MSKNTVYVIGAGASKEVNLPTGKELKDKIVHMLDIQVEYRRLEKGDSRIYEALRQLGKEPESQNIDLRPFTEAAWRIRDALPQAISIDTFIDTNRSDKYIAICGKLAIVRSILEAEQHSALYLNTAIEGPPLEYTKLQKTWYHSFFQLLTENCEIHELKERLSSLTLIIFNYDRCVEHYLYYSLQNYYGIHKEEAAKMVKSINIYHPYGLVGGLSWIHQGESMDFGSEPSSEKLLSLSDMIKTYSEGTDPKSSEITEIKKHMGNADRVVFLGFAFHDTNMKLISPGVHQQRKRMHVECFASTYGISDSDDKVIKRQLHKLYNDNIIVETKPKLCRELFEEYRKGLSFS
jgi:hypothetical protein